MSPVFGILLLLAICLLLGLVFTRVPVRVSYFIASGIGMVVASVALYAWYQTKIPQQTALISFHGQIVSVKTKVPLTRDLVFQIQGSSLKFEYIDWYPQYWEVRNELENQAFATLFVENSYSEGHLTHVWAFSTDSITVTYNDIASRVRRNKELGLWLGLIVGSVSIILPFAPVRRRRNSGLN